MAGYAQIWIRLPADYLNLKTLCGFLTRIERAAALLRSPICDCPPIDLAISEEWLAIDHPMGTTQEAGPLLKTITEETQLDALYYSGETVCDTMVYCHWRAGKLLRAIENQLVADYLNNPDPFFWKVVEGEPEFWEREVFFPEAVLEYRLREGYKGGEAERQALQEYWQAGKIIQGRKEPGFGTIGELFWEIVERNNLPNTRSVWHRPTGLRGT